MLNVHRQGQKCWKYYDNFILQNPYHWRQSLLLFNTDYNKHVIFNNSLYYSRVKFGL